VSLDNKCSYFKYISNKKNNVFLVGLAISAILFFALSDHIIYFNMLEIKRICSLIIC
jgi:hypothetical protein